MAYHWLAQGASTPLQVHLYLDGVAIGQFSLAVATVGGQSVAVRRADKPPGLSSAVYEFTPPEPPSTDCVCQATAGCNNPPAGVHHAVTDAAGAILPCRAVGGPIVNDNGDGTYGYVSLGTLTATATQLFQFQVFRT